MTLTVVDALGFAAFLANVAGNLMLAWQTIWGWVVRLVAISLWFAYGYEEASMPLLVNGVVFFVINCFGLWKWRRDRRKVAA